MTDGDQLFIVRDTAVDARSPDEKLKINWMLTE
jgi:hypothetical protein